MNPTNTTIPPNGPSLVVRLQEENIKLRQMTAELRHKYVELKKRCRKYEKRLARWEVKKDKIRKVQKFLAKIYPSDEEDEEDQSDLDGEVTSDHLGRSSSLGPSPAHANGGVVGGTGNPASAVFATLRPNFTREDYERTLALANAGFTNNEGSSSFYISFPRPLTPSHLPGAAGTTTTTTINRVPSGNNDPSPNRSQANSNSAALPTSPAAMTAATATNNKNTSNASNSRSSFAGPATVKRLRKEGSASLTSTTTGTNSSSSPASSTPTTKSSSSSSPSVAKKSTGRTDSTTGVGGPLSKKATPPPPPRSQAANTQRSSPPSSHQTAKKTTRRNSAASLSNNADNDAPCSVCGAVVEEDDNVMIFCDGCNLCVHQSCYGVENIPRGSWFCAPCKELLPKESASTVACPFCPVRGGALKPLNRPFSREGKTYRWAHILCRNWIPELYFGDLDTLEPIMGAESVAANRWKLSCTLCKSRKGGAPIQCNARRCATSFHVTCAARSPDILMMGLSGSEYPNGFQLNSFCLKHREDGEEKRELCEEPAMMYGVAARHSKM